MSSKLVGSDIPGLQVPVPIRFLWLFSGIILLALANANLAYMMTVSNSTPTEAVGTTTQVDSSQDEGESDKEVVTICTLKDVHCDSEPEITIKAARLEGGQPMKIGASPSMQAMVDYAWSISKSMDFVLTIEAESGFNPQARNVNRNGTVDSGIAQINHYYHPQIVKDPRFSDWKWQLEQGWKLYKGGTRFYGFDVRHKVKNRFVMK